MFWPKTTWKADHAECGAEEENGVANIVEVEILNAEDDYSLVSIA